MRDRGRWRVGVVEPVTFGVAELVPDPTRPAGWTLLVDEVAQSYVDLDDPMHLEFEYVRRITSVVNTAWPAGQPIRALHLGGGGLTIPRYLATTRPDSRQLVIEGDGELAALVQRVLPVAPSAAIEVSIGDASEAVRHLVAGRTEPAGYHLVVADAYQGAQLAAGLTSPEFLRDVAALLCPGGVYTLNVTDLPQLMFTRQQAATLLDLFGDVCVMGESRMLHGRRFGNTVLAATQEPGGLPIDRIAAAVARDPRRGRLLHGAELSEFVAGVPPVPAASPPAGRIEELTASPEDVGVPVHLPGQGE